MTSPSGFRCWAWRSGRARRATRITASPTSRRDQGAKRSRLAWAALAGITLAGFAVRLSNFHQGLFADELSSAWIVKGHSLSYVLSSVRSNDEITPPLYFVLAWGSLKLGSSPDLLRLPSLLAGTVTIPLIYLVGRRAVGQWAGVMAAAAFAFSPFMIFYSTEARAYSVMILMLVTSTLAMLIAAERLQARWWLAYGAFSCAAMYSHYTAVFPLVAQFLWLLWVHPSGRRAAVLANLGALVAFAPWLPGFVADNNSPTTVILDGLQPFTPHAVRLAVENWAIGFPFVSLRMLPGAPAIILIATGLVTCAIGIATRLVGQGREAGGRVARLVRSLPSGTVLVFALALSTPLAEALLSAVGTNLLGARNLNSAWPGLALTLGAAVVAAGPVLAPVAAAFVLAGFGIGALKTTQSFSARPDFNSSAELIEREAGPDDVIVDAATFTPVPLTSLDAYLTQGRPEFRLGLPRSDKPFTVFDPVPAADRLVRRAFGTAARADAQVFLLTLDPPNSYGRLAGDGAPARFRIVQRHVFPGLRDLAVIVFAPRGPGRAPSANPGP